MTTIDDAKKLMRTEAGREKLERLLLAMNPQQQRDWRAAIAKSEPPYAQVMRDLYAA